MSVRPDYTTGLITLTSGSVDFTIPDAQLQSVYIQQGDTIFLPEKGLILTVASITSQTTGTLVDECPAAAAGVDQPYRLRYQPDGSRLSGQVQSLIELLDTGYAQLWNAQVANMAGRAQYDDEDKDFVVLVSDVGDGSAEIFSKNSVTSGDWSAGARLTGKDGTDGTPGTPGTPGEDGSPGTPGADGDDGWTAVEAGVTDGERRVRQIVDWTGGTGTKPATGVYVGTTGYVPNIADAVDFRGPGGAGAGDMLASVYDPNAKNADAFDMDNMVESADSKIMTAAERTKLNNVATGATANSSDAFLRARANHTGVIPNAGLPLRLGESAWENPVTDWNDAIQTGWYGGAQAANGPASSRYVGFVMYGDSANVSQTLYEYDTRATGDTRTWQRTGFFAGGSWTWSAWYRLRLSEAEQQALWDARYEPLGGGGGSGIYHNVMDYGAVGDGVADDTTAIQDAIDDCGTQGGTVYLPAGKYKTTAALNITNNGIQILGDSSQGTDIQPATVGQDVFVFEKSGSSIEYCSIRHLRIEPTALVDRCIKFINHYWCAIEDVVCAGNHQVGIEIYRGSVAYNMIFKDVLVNTSTDSGCVLGQNGTGSLQNVIMSNACFNGSAGRGLAVFSCGGLLWSNGECLGCDVGMYVRPGAAEQWVKGMYISNVFFDTSQSDTVQLFIGTNVINKINYCTFTNCSFNASVAGNGVNIGGYSVRPGNITNLSFIGCHFTINARNGIYVNYAKRIDIQGCHFISNNIINDAGSHGVSIDHADSIRVIGGASGPTDEFATNRQKAGVAVGTVATNVLVNGTDVRGNVTKGIIDGSGVAVIRDCVGFRTYNRGVGNIPTGQSSVVINHGLDATPPDVFVLAQALTNPGTVGGGQLYVSGLTSTSFTVGISTAISGGSLYFFWQITSENGHQ